MTGWPGNTAARPASSTPARPLSLRWWPPMSAVPARNREPAGSGPLAEWAETGQAAPMLAATMRRYLRQAATFLAPRSVDAADTALRQLTRWLLASTSITSVAQIRRDDIEDFKV